MLSVYFDASGTHRESDVVAIAGCIATDHHWERFAREWTGILAGAGLEPPVFHATDFERPERPDGWSLEKKIRVRQHLITKIEKRTRERFGLAVIVPEYRMAVREGRAPNLTPLAFAVMEVVKQVGNWAVTLPKTHVIRYYFEDQSERRGDVANGMDFIQSRPKLLERFRGAAWGWVPKETAPAQAADMLAYEIWKESLNGLPPPPGSRPMRRSLRALTHLMPRFTYYAADTWAAERRKRGT
jgi:hypothetical protein